MDCSIHGHNLPTLIITCRGSRHSTKVGPAWSSNERSVRSHTLFLKISILQNNLFWNGSHEHIYNIINQSRHMNAKIYVPWLIIFIGTDIILILKTIPFPWFWIFKVHKLSSIVFKVNRITFLHTVLEMARAYPVVGAGRLAICASGCKKVLLKVKASYKF